MISMTGVRSTGGLDDSTWNHGSNRRNILHVNVDWWRDYGNIEEIHMNLNISPSILCDEGRLLRFPRTHIPANLNKGFT